MKKDAIDNKIIELIKKDENISNPEYPVYSEFRKKRLLKESGNFLIQDQRY